jgi:hypothetical protein
MTVSAPHLSAHFSFSTSSSVPEETGDAPMLALIFVFDARPIAMGSSLKPRCARFAGITMRPAAISSRTSVTVRCGSRSATRFISGVMTPRRALSSCVIGVKDFGWMTRRHWPRALANSTESKASPQQFVQGFPPFGAPVGPVGASASSTVDQPDGRKSHAVFALGSGMPGVSGDANAYGPPMSARFANEPGVVPCAAVDGLCAPWSGRS